MDKFVVKLKRHSSSYETDQGEQPQKVLLTGVRTVGLPGHRQKSSHRRLVQLLATMFQHIPQACIRSYAYGKAFYWGWRKKFALKITICSKNKQFSLKLTFLVLSDGGLKSLVNLFYKV